MIRGTEQPFKFTTAFDFDDICKIEVVWSQPYNTGTLVAPMPIIKSYNRQVEKIDLWNPTGADTKTIYGVGTKYYRYDSSAEDFVLNNTKPTEEDILGGTLTVYPVESNDTHISKVYKCPTSYYQYNPNTAKWDITIDAPSTDLISLSQAGTPDDSADRKRIYVYNQSYHRYNGTKWVKSTTEILPIEETSYWDSSKENAMVADAYYYDRDKTYCALETYYKYDGNNWQTYGRPQEVRALNNDCDTSKIYMMKELYYQYNAATDQFEKTGVREVYYQYNKTSQKWEECECPCVNAEELDLWIDADEHDTNKIYVCKNVYYRYNAGLGTPAWEASNNMLVPVIEIDEWVDADYHDTSKIYMCPTRYYQYNIEKEAWEEAEKIAQPQVVKLKYWTNPIDRDKKNIYLCGQTYFQYNSENEAWISSASYKIQLTQINYPSEATDPSKIYECSPIYYVYEEGVWEEHKNVANAVHNDGFAPVDGNPKSFIAVLSVEETMRFNEKYKGRVQATVYCDAVNRTDKSKIEYFTVYPTLTDEIIGGSSSDTINPEYIILDGGDVI